MNAQVSSQSFDNEIARNRLWWVIPLATIFAITANVILYLLVTRILGEPLLFPEQLPPPETTPMPMSDVVIFSVIFSLGAAIVFILVANFNQRPIKTYLIISTIVLALSLALPFRVPTPPVTVLAKLTLVAMHIIGALAVVGTLVGLGRQRRFGEVKKD